MRKIDLSSLLDDVTNFGQILGPAEHRILTNATLLLQGQFPTDEATKAAYITRSTETQSDLINLKGRLAYIHAMKQNEKNAYLGNLIYNEDYKARDRQYIALDQDSKYRDLCETVDILEVVKTLVEDLLWSCKITMQRV